MGCRLWRRTESDKTEATYTPAACSFPGENARSWEALGEARPGQRSVGVWETCLAPGWPQLRSGLPFGPRSQASLQKAQGPGVCTLPKLPASRALCQAKRAPGLRSPAVAWPPSLSAVRRESGSQRPCLGEPRPALPTWEAQVSSIAGEFFSS